MHEPGLAGIMVVVPDQVQESMHQEQVQFERQGDTKTRSLPGRRVGRDDHLAK
jgi:hypothetical protein